MASSAASFCDPGHMAIGSASPGRRVAIAWRATGQSVKEGRQVRWIQGHEEGKGASAASVRIPAAATYPRAVSFV